MTKACKISLFAVIALFLAVAPSAFADTTATMYLAGAGSNVADGVYVGPYTATINGGSDTPLICDDYTHDSYVGETWTADVSTMSNLADVRFSPGNYDQVAYLATILFGLGNSPSNYAEADAVQFAIWSINDPSAIAPATCFGASADDCVSYWLKQAADQTYTAGEFANILIYTPQSGGDPQEFIVETPEPGTILLLCMGLTSLFLLKRRQTLTSLI